MFLGEPRGPDWSRSQACNAASEAAGDWDLALVADCDTIPDAPSIHASVAWLQAMGLAAVRPHMERAMLNANGTLKFLQRGPDGLDPKRHLETQHQGGGLLIVTREAWDAIGGYDETFIGWGYEDSDFNLRLLRYACEELGNPKGWDRLPGRAYHLWHPRGSSVKETAPRPESKARYRQMLKDFEPYIKAWASDKGLKSPRYIF